MQAATAASEAASETDAPAALSTQPEPNRAHKPPSRREDPALPETQPPVVAGSIPLRSGPRWRLIVAALAAVLVVLGTWIWWKQPGVVGSNHDSEAASAAQGAPQPTEAEPPGTEARASPAPA